VMLFYPSANRDDAVFASPDVLDVRREPNPHLASGSVRTSAWVRRSPDSSSA
jgi:cytochrome P450